MFIEAIKNKIADVIDKKELSRSLDNSLKETKDTVMKTIKEGSDFFNTKNLKNPISKSKTDQFFRINKNLKSDGIFDAFVKREDDLEVNMSFVSELMKKEFSDKIAKDSLDFRQVNILKIIDLLEFFNRYSLALLTYFYVLEAAVELKHDRYVQEAMTKNQQKFIDDNWLSFCNVCSVLFTDKNDFVKKLEKVTKVEVLNENESVLRETLGVNEISPFVNGFIATRWNPIIWVRRIIADWQVSRYKALEDNVRLLEIRRLHLEKLRRGEQDPVLEKSIKEVEDMLTIQQYKLDKLTKAYGLDEE